MEGGHSEVGAPLERGRRRRRPQDEPGSEDEEVVEVEEEDGFALRVGLFGRVGGWVGGWVGTRRFE